MEIFQKFKVLLIAILFFCLPVSTYGNNLKLGFGRYLFISCNASDQFAVEWSTSIPNTTSDVKSAIVKCILVDTSDMTIAEDTALIQVQPFGTRTVGSTQFMPPEQANRIMAILFEIL